MKKFISFFSVLVLTLFCSFSFKTYALANGLVCIDAPVANATVKNSVTVRGWSLNLKGVKSVSIYLDNKYVGNATIGISRNDVARIYGKNYAGAANSGYTYTLNTTNIVSGKHTIKVLSSGKNGIDTASTRTFTKQGSIICLDSPKADSRNVADNFEVKGWAISPSGIKNVQVFVDGKSVGYANYGSSRPDVNTVKNGDGYFKDATNSGYSYTVNVNNLTYATHTVKIVANGNDGNASATWFNIKRMKKNTKRTIIMIDSPISKNVYSGDVEMRGWVVSGEGPCDVKAYVDGKEVAGLNTGITRNDVMKNVNQNFGVGAFIDPANSGFKGTISADILSSGTHTFTIKATTPTSKTVTSQSRTFTVKKASPLIYIDNPTTTSNCITDSLYVRGWSVNASAVKSVSVYIDNKYICDAQPGQSRPDVNAAKNENNQYKDAVNSGYSVTIPYTKLSGISSGYHTLKVVSAGYDGSAVATTKAIKRVSPNIGLDNKNFKADYDFKLTGWAMTCSGVKSIQVKYGTHTVNVTDFNLESSDVKSKYDPSGITYSNSAKARFTVDLDIDTLQSGNNNIVFYITEKDGRVFTYSTTIEKVSYHTIYCLDTPKNGTNYNKYTTSSYTIHGWALNPSGVSKVLATVDGKSVSVTNGIKSEQAIINRGGGKYAGAENARFSTAAISLSDYSIGEHNVVVTIVGNNGVETTITSTFNVTDRYYTSYNISAADMSTKTGVSLSLVDPDKIIAGSDSGIYQFMTLNYVDGITVDQLNTMLKGRGVLEGHGQDFLNAGKTYNINPVYLVAHARIESGNGTSQLSTGVKVGDTTYYDQYGIGAYDNDVLNGGTTTAKKYNWTSVQSSIIGGAKWISEVYIWGGKPNQDTLYEMRFDPAYYDGTYTKCYCYATDPNWAQSIAKLIYQYKSILDDKAINFDVPKYK